MSFSANHFLQQSLQKRIEQNALRELVSNPHLIDFCSNDYLGFARSEELKYAIEKEYNSLEQQTNGAAGSRLLAGNSKYAEDLEKEIAHFHQAEAGLIYNSGYDANVGLFSCIGQKESTIIYDELIHASVHDGIKMSSATSFMFKHNNLLHLEERLKTVQGLVFVAVESIYSMDGDEASLVEIATLCKKYNANLIVDEAHATGITSNYGKGLVQNLQLQNVVFARIHTFGKAMGCHGAIVVGTELLRNYLINFSRSFIYTTALPIKSLVSIKQSYRILLTSEGELARLHQLIYHFKSLWVKNKEVELIESNSPIQCVIVSGNLQVKKLANQLQMSGFDIRPILSPTVAKGKERLRICIHAFNTDKELEEITVGIRKFFEKEIMER